MRESRHPRKGDDKSCFGNRQLGLCIGKWGSKHDWRLAARATVPECSRCKQPKPTDSRPAHPASAAAANIRNSGSSGSGIEPVFGRSVSDATADELASCFLVDPAGSAFTNHSRTYDASGLSNFIYKKLGILDQQHDISLQAGQAICNLRPNLGVGALIHVVGPNYQGRLSDPQYEAQLEQAVISTAGVVESEMASRPNVKYVWLPLISSVIYAPEDLNLDDYMNLYLKLVQRHLCPLGLPVHLGLFTQDEQEAYKRATRLTFM